MPPFAKQDRSVANRFEPEPPELLAEVVELVLAELELLLDEPPHAARTRQADNAPMACIERCVTGE